jgi:hypothetical protein
MNATTYECLVCERPVEEDESHVRLVRSGGDPRPVHEACMRSIRRTGPWPETGRGARLSR